MFTDYSQSFQSDSDSTRANGRNSSGVAKPPGAQIRFVARPYGSQVVVLRSITLLQETRGGLAGVEAQLHTSSWGWRVIKHNAQTLH